jgi:homopolymeric O-antigen transport system permease protein
MTETADHGRGQSLEAAPNGVVVNHADETVQLIRPSARFPRLELRELWASRELALVFARRDLSLRYRQTVFGVGWAVLQPLIAVGVFSVIFGSAAGIDTGNVPYPVFAFAGMALWFFISGAVSSAAASLVEHPDLVTKVWFPRMLAPLAAALAALLDLVIATALAVVAMVAYQVAPGPQLLLLPLFAALAFAISIGAGLWLCAANVLYRDVRHALAFLLQIWLFVTPVVYPITIIDGAWRYVLALNPVTGVIEGWRWALIGGPMPGPWFWVSIAALVMLLASGAVFFRIAERQFADRI